MRKSNNKNIFWNIVIGIASIVLFIFVMRELLSIKEIFIDFLKK